MCVHVVCREKERGLGRRKDGDCMLHTIYAAGGLETFFSFKLGIYGLLCRFRWFCMRVKELCGGIY